MSGTNKSDNTRGIRLSNTHQATNSLITRSLSEKSQLRMVLGQGIPYFCRTPLRAALGTLFKSLVMTQCYEI